MTGDYNLPSFALTECLIFNKTMCDELGLEYPYQMVLDGTWTHDRFLEYIKKGSKDLNGDGALVGGGGQHPPPPRECTSE